MTCKNIALFLIATVTLILNLMPLELTLLRYSVAGQSFITLDVEHSFIYRTILYYVDRIAVSASKPSAI